MHKLGDILREISQASFPSVAPVELTYAKALDKQESGVQMWVVTFIFMVDLCSNYPAGSLSVLGADIPQNGMRLGKVEKQWKEGKCSVYSHFPSFRQECLIRVTCASQPEHYWHSELAFSLEGCCPVHLGYLAEPLPSTSYVTVASGLLWGQKKMSLDIAKCSLGGKIDPRSYSSSSKG